MSGCHSFDIYFRVFDENLNNLTYRNSELFFVVTLLTSYVIKSCDFNLILFGGTLLPYFTFVVAFGNTCLSVYSFFYRINRHIPLLWLFPLTNMTAAVLQARIEELEEELEAERQARAKVSVILTSSCRKFNRGRNFLVPKLIHYLLIRNYSTL